LQSSVGFDGHFYIVSVAGTTNLNGIASWNIGDWAIFTGGVWLKIDNVSGSNLEIKNEGITLTTAATSIDFIGDAVTATAVGTAVTVNVTGGGVAASTNNLFAYYNFI
jgi:hypothetical protein